jgi:hypothetical protein
MIFHAFGLSAYGQIDTIRLGQSYGLLLSGFTRLDYFYDSRKTAEAVEGLFTFYPLNQALDAKGKDMELNLSATDIFNAMGVDQRIEKPDGSVVDYQNFYETKIFTLGLKYKF